MSGKTSAADPAEYIKKPQPEDDVNNGTAAEEEPEPLKFSPEEEAVSTATPTISIHCLACTFVLTKSFHTGASRRVKHTQD